MILFFCKLCTEIDTVLINIVHILNPLIVFSTFKFDGFFFGGGRGGVKKNQTVHVIFIKAIKVWFVWIKKLNESIYHLHPFVFLLLVL